MVTGFRFERFAPGSRLASFIATAALLAASFLPGLAGAAGPPKPLASAECHGVVGLSAGTGSADLPKGNFGEVMSFTTGSPAVSTAKGAKPVGGSFYVSVDAKCNSQTPCVQAGTFTGNISKTGLMTLTFSDPVGAAAGSGLFDGCQQTYLVQTAFANTGAVFIGNSLITQNSATGAPTCKVAGSRLIFSCVATKS